jgi:hypothetical protein
MTKTTSSTVPQATRPLYTALHTTLSSAVHRRRHADGHYAR